MRAYRLLAAVLLLACLLLAGCGASAVPAEEPAVQEKAEPSPLQTPALSEPAAEPEPTVEPEPTAEPEPSVEPEPTAEPEPTPEPTPAPEPELTIALSEEELSFSHKGEKVSIYAGEADLSRVSWTTDDPSVAMVSRGTVMSTGAGETTIHASYGSQELSCHVVCTAPEDEFAVLDPSILNAPLLNPPVLTEEEDTLARSFFENTAFLGDSVSYVLYQWESKEDWLGDVTFLVRGGISLQSAVTGRWEVFYQGVSCSFGDALAASGADKAFIMMGANDLAQFGVDGTFDYYKTFMEQVQEKNPDVEFYIQSVTPVWTKAEWNKFNNEMIDEFNVLLRAYAEENDYHYVDVAPYFKDYTNGLATPYESDQLMHFNGDGCYVWSLALKEYALQQLKEDKP